MQDFTLDKNFSDFLKNEEKLIQEHFENEDMSALEHAVEQPKESSVQRIIAYNKALSVKQSLWVKPISFVLN